MIYDRRASAADLAAALSALRLRSIAVECLRIGVIVLAVVAPALAMFSMAARRQEPFSGATLACLAVVPLAVFGGTRIRPLSRMRIDAARTLLGSLPVAPGEQVSLRLDLGRIERPDLRVPRDPDGFDPPPGAIQTFYDCAWLLFSTRLENGASLRFTRRERLRIDERPAAEASRNVRVPVAMTASSWLDDVEVVFADATGYRSGAFVPTRSPEARLALPERLNVVACEVEADRAHLVVRSRWAWPAHRDVTRGAVDGATWVKQAYALAGRTASAIRPR